MMDEREGERDEWREGRARWERSRRDKWREGRARRGAWQEGCVAGGVRGRKGGQGGELEKETEREREREKDRGCKKSAYECSTRCIFPLCRLF